MPRANEVFDVINRLRELVWWDLVVLTQDFHPADHASFASNNDGANIFETRTLPEVGEQVMWPDHCVQGTPGSEFHPDLVRHESDVVVQKGKVREVDSYSGFGDASEGHTKEKTELEQLLRERGVTDVFVAGLAADFCVSFTAKDAAKAGFRSYLVRDGTRGISPEGTNA